jgi:hypothetical protein
MDGSATGQFSLTITESLFGSENPAVTRLHAEVVCMTVVGNRAWVGGVVKSASNPDWVGGETAWAVEDNGDGPATTDRISFMNLPPQQVPGFAQQACQQRFWNPDRPIDAGNVVIQDDARVTGSGHLWNPGTRRVFSFSAREHIDGSASGQFTLNIDEPLFGSVNPSNTRLHAEVVCVEVDGNRAWVGGVVTNASNPAWIGAETGWAVEDNGQGRAAVDRISFMRLPPQHVPGFAQSTCDSRVFTPDRAIDAGNVTVR